MITLFEDIKITKGYNRSLLLDFTKGKFEFLDNEVAKLLDFISDYQDFDDILINNEKFTVELTQLREWFVFNEFVSKDFIFPKISDFNESAYPFQCITIEVSKEILDHIELFFPIFIELTQNFIFIVNYEEEIFKILNLFKNYEHIHIQILTKYGILSPEDITIEFKNISFDYYYEKIKNFSDISISTNNFVYRENLNYNSGYFEKLFINLNGDIAINLFDDFKIGVFKDMKSKSDFIELKNHQLYNFYVNSKSDHIQVCRECELRYTCTDMKQPKIAKSGLLYKEKECSYNPFISKWSDEEDYLTLVECGVISNENEFSIDHEKIARINKELWGEE